MVHCDECDGDVQKGEWSNVVEEFVEELVKEVGQGFIEQTSL